MYFQRQTKFNSHSGSFLLGALMAVAILSVSLVIIVRSHLGALQAQVFAKDYALASLLLEQEMMGVVENGYAASGIDVKKNLAAPYDRFTFTLTTLPAGNEYYFDKLNKVEGVLSWTSGQKTRSISASTFIFAAQQ